MAKRIAIVQARMGASRLPGKVLMDLHGRPVLDWVLERVRRARRLDDVIVATTLAHADDAIVRCGSDLGVKCFRGSERDVLGRFVAAAHEHRADVIVRVNADNPLIDPQYIDALLDRIDAGGVDYASYRLSDGRHVMLSAVSFFAEALTADCLKRVDSFIREPFEREHVTLGIYSRPQRFKIDLMPVPPECDLPQLRLTLDREQDLELLRELFATLSSPLQANAASIVAEVRRHPDWLTRMAQLNAANQMSPSGSAPSATSAYPGERSTLLPRARGLNFRQSVRLNVLPTLARLGHAAGISWPILGTKLGRESLIAQLAASEPPLPIETPDRPLDVIFYTMMGGNHRLSSVEVVLGRAMAARGHRVRYVLCDQALPLCEVKADAVESRWPELCARCYEFGRRFVGQSGCEVMRASELAAAQQDDGEWNEFVESALLKHFRVGVLDEDERVKQRRQMFRESARLTARIGKQLVAMRPDRVVMSHGVYCTWGPARRVLLDASIPVITYAEGKRRQTEIFNWTHSSDWWDVAGEWERVKDVPLTTQQETQIDVYLQSRRRHTQDTRVYNFGDEEPAAAIRQRLNLAPDQRTFVLFTNVLWDAASAQREICFRDPIEWVVETIRWFTQHPESQLVVKVHPAEVVIGTRQPFVGLIREKFARLPDNVRIIEPREPVNSWSIMQVADLGLVHTSTIGMELPLENVPCAVVSRTHFRGKGFTIDVNCRDEYFRLLESYQPLPPDQRQRMRDVARRYAYLLFERYQLPFPFLIDSGSVDDVRALDQISPGQLLSHPSIRILLDAIENFGEFLLPLPMNGHA